MEEYLFKEEIKTELEDTESEMPIVKFEDCIKSELLYDEELTWGKDLNTVELELTKDCGKTGIEVYDELKKETEDILDSPMLESSARDKNDIGLHCSVKQECDYDMNEEVEIKNDIDFGGMITSENFLQSCEDNAEDSFQAEGEMQNSTYKLNDEEVKEEKQSNREKNIGTEIIERKQDFKCDICSFTTKSKSYLQIHIDGVHHGKKYYKCSRCDYSTTWQKCLRNHKNRHHPNESMLKCDLCEFSSDYKWDVRKHMNSIHLKKQKHKCDDCEYSTWEISNLRKHKKNIHFDGIGPEQGKEFKCDFCDFSTMYKSSLRGHIESVHLQLNKYHCHLCDYTTNYRSYLQPHVDKVHLDKKPYKCSECDYSTSWKSRLQAHNDRKHSNETVGKLKKEFKCNLCHIVTKYKSSLKNHINKIHLRKQYKCDKCDYSTRWTSCLIAHRKTKHPNVNASEFKCSGSGPGQLGPSETKY